jgi:hypothetical protein
MFHGGIPHFGAVRRDKNFFASIGVDALLQNRATRMRGMCTLKVPCAFMLRAFYHSSKVGIIMKDFYMLFYF